MWADNWVNGIKPSFENQAFKRIELNKTTGRKNKFVKMKPVNWLVVDFVEPGKTKNKLRVNAKEVAMQ